MWWTASRFEISDDSERCASNPSAEQLGKFGEIVEQSAGGVQFKVNATGDSRVQGVAGRVTVTDIDIQECRSRK